MSKEKEKMYVVKKYIKALSASSAIRLDKTTPVHEVWISEEWGKRSLADAIGFTVESEDEE